MNQVYLDNAATTRVIPQVFEVMKPFFCENFGNPSGMYSISRNAKKVLDEARQTVASILNCAVDEIIFTGGGTESDNLAIFGVVEKKYSSKKNHILTSSIEHPAVLNCFRKLENKCEVSFISPNREGEVTPEKFKESIKENSFFASLILANNEIGTINDISEISKITQKNGIIFHTDACQAGGTIDLDTKKLGVDLMTLNGSKIFGPKGIGLLFKKKSIKIEPQLYGGGQEFGLRSGTENVPAIVGFAKALEIAQKKRLEETRKYKKWQDKMIDFIAREIPDSRLNGARKNRTVNNLNFSFLNTEGETVLLMLDALGFSVATGSACSTASLKISPVLAGIKMPHEIAHGSVRITFGRDTTEQNIDDFLVVLKKVIEKTRAISAVNFSKKDFPDWF
jgi:cysteine desulfurase